MNLLNNPLVLSLIKNQLPAIIDNLDDLEKGLTSYINSFELEENETHTVLFTETQDENLFFCIGAFNKRTMVRLIHIKPAKVFVKELINNAFKDEKDGNV